MRLRTWLGLNKTEALDQPPPIGWMAPRKSCFVAAIPRSGSNFLCSAIHDAHALGYPYEYFNDRLPDRIKKFLTSRGRELLNGRRFRHRKVTVMQRGWHARLAGTTHNDVTGIKFHGWQFQLANRHLRMPQLFPNPYWIWLRREDRLAQAISFEIGHQTEAWISIRPEKREPVYSTSAVLKQLRNIEISEKFWQDYFEGSGIRPLCLWYEDIVRDPAASVAAVADFVGEPLVDVPEQHRQPNPLSRISMQRNERTLDWTRRFLSELPDGVSSGNFAHRDQCNFG
jgi:LPS sulfotransferase NodH